MTHEHEHTADPFTDPDELFDVLEQPTTIDPAGRPSGRTKRRADVHRDGDWHRAFHCWVTCETGAPTGPELILQRRGLHKDTWPGRLDVTVGGHFTAGETLVEVLREAEEEIGQAVTLDQLLPLGRRVCVNDREGGVRDREIQEVYLWRSPLRLRDYRPQPIELVSLESVPITGLLEVFDGRRREAAGRRLHPNGALDESLVRRADFIPTLDRYVHRMVVLADLALRGYPHLVL